MVAVADEWAVEAGAAFAARFQALVLQVGAVVFDVLVLAAAPQDPRPFSDYVEKSCAFAVSVAAFVRPLRVLLEAVAAHAAALLTNSQTLLVAFLAAPNQNSL
jgi:hypothetical protein